MNLLTFLDFNKNEARNLVTQNLGTAPASPVKGQKYFDTTANAEYTYNGTSWIPTDATKATGIPNAALATNPLARANHTGTQVSATLSDLAATVQAYRLDQFAAPNVPLPLGSQRITGLADPTGVQDGATKNYVDTNLQNAAAGIASKSPVRAVATVNVATLSGATTIDGVSLVAGDRVLLTGQTTASQNGPYVVAAGAWARPSGDVSGSNGELEPGAMWFASEGTTNAQTQWRVSTTGVITAGTTSVAVVQFGAAASYSAGNGLLLTGSIFSAQAVAAGGVVSAAGGLSVDTTVVARKYSVAVGNGSLTSITVTHNLNTLDVIAAIRDTSGNVVMVDWQAATVNTVILTFTTAPATNAYRCTVVG